jgi:tetratricopeptide (TPR) repeat protein
VIGALAAAALAFVLVRSERGLSDRVERRTIAAASAPPPLEPTTNEPAPRAVPRVEPAFETRAIEGPEVEAPAVKAPVVDAGEPRRVPGRARQVFGAGADKHREVIERDSLVEDSPLAAFRAGWEALRAQRYADAIAAFDRATDPAVAEDAAFWAAIAAQRAGQPDDARKRLDLFLATFPESPRAESARRAREVLR